MRACIVQAPESTRAVPPPSLFSHPRFVRIFLLCSPIIRPRIKPLLERSLNSMPLQKSTTAVSIYDAKLVARASAARERSGSRRGGGAWPRLLLTTEPKKATTTTLTHRGTKQRACKRLTLRVRRAHQVGRTTSSRRSHPSRPGRRRGVRAPRAAPAADGQRHECDRRAKKKPAAAEGGVSQLNEVDLARRSK